LPGTRAPFRHLPLDLGDADASRAGIQDLSEVTHVVYAAVSGSRA
jgi:hypothetical protein